MKKTKANMKTLSLALLLGTLPLLAHEAADGHTECCEGFSFLFEDAIGANFITSDDEFFSSSSPVDLVVCKVRNLSRRKRETLELNAPYITKEHPEEIQKQNFLLATSSGSGVLLNCKQISGELTPTWNFSKKEERSLDYRIWATVLNEHPEIAFNQKEMNIDYLYFVPYHEDESCIYTLTWCPASAVSGQAELAQNAVFFPSESGEQRRLGLVISPLLQLTADKDGISMNTTLGKSQLSFHLKWRARDKAGNEWVLAWRKQKFPTTAPHNEMRDSRIPGRSKKRTGKKP